MYNKADRENNGAAAVPIKTVHFEYDYSLCPAVPNNSGNSVIVDGININQNKGKLSLKKVWFTYGSSKKGRLSPYEFTYSSSGNFAYDHAAIDRWGNYKPNNCSMPNSEFPYAEQNKVLADSYAQAWKLEQVNLPSGGSIHMKYEADEYSHVQHKRAMRMFNIKGFGLAPIFDPGSVDSKLYAGSNKTHRPYLFFGLDETIPASTPQIKKLLKEKYFEKMQYLYFKCLVDITGKGDYEYVPGYLQIEDYGVTNAISGNHNYGWIKVKDVNVLDSGDDFSQVELPGFANLVFEVIDVGNSLINGVINDPKKTHPIAYASWQFGRLNLHEKIYPEMNCNQNNTLSTIGTALNTISGITTGLFGLGGLPNISDVFDFASSSEFQCLIQYLQTSFGMDLATITRGGINYAFRDKGYGKQVNLNNSFIRLYEPDKLKIGGGYRVSEITATDGWGSMGGSDQTYGQTYDYSIEEDGEIVSSGVASYEPFIGGEENSWHQPKFYKTSNMLFPDDHHYIDAPMGESVFPASVVGYRQVKVANLERTHVTKTATGYQLYEFYTAKSFPTIVKETPLDAKMITTDADAAKKFDNPYTEVDISDVEFKSVEMYGATQGYVIETNDMHGKPRARGMYDIANKQVDEVRYEYKKETGLSPGTHRLNNRVQTYTSSGAIQSTILGQEVDISMDTRYSQMSNEIVFPTTSYNISINAGIRKNTHREGQYRKFASSVLTKVVSKTGILEKIFIKDGSSTILQKNLAFDQKTGNPLLLSVENNYEDPVYNFSYPAYWIYDGMAHAFHNQGTELKETLVNEVTNTNGQIIFPNANNYFFPGDEIIVKNSVTNVFYPDKYWIIQKDGSSTNYLIDKDGQFPLTMLNDGKLKTYKVLRSGRRNHVSVQAAAFNSLNNPSGTSLNNRSKTITSSAAEFTDNREMYCGIDYGDPVPLVPGFGSMSQLIDFLNQLVSNGQFVTTGTSTTVNVSNYPYTSLFNYLIPNYQNCDSLIFRTDYGGGNYFFYFDCLQGGPTRYFANVFNTLPGGYNISDITHFSNPDLTVYPGTYNQLTVSLICPMEIQLILALVR